MIQMKWMNGIEPQTTFPKVKPQAAATADMAAVSKAAAMTMPVQSAEAVATQPSKAVAVTGKPTDEKVETAAEKETGVKFELSEAGEALMKQAYQQQVESAKQSGNAFRDFAKIMEIARRISRGDRVPAQDEKKLMEFDGDLYQAAKAAALVNANKKHKRHKSLFGDEDDDQRNKLRALDQEAGETASGADTQTTDGAGAAEAATGDAAEIAEG